MGLARSTYYSEAKSQPLEEARLVARIAEICAEWPRYGYRRVTAQLHNEDLIVNRKKVMRLMKENGLSVRPRRRFVVTTQSSRDGPIFPNLSRTVELDAPNQLWVADITYIAIASGFVYLAAVLDAWSRRCGRLCHRPAHRCQVDAGSPQGRDHLAQTAARLHPSFRSRAPICRRRLPRRACQARPKGLNGPAWQPL